MIASRANRITLLFFIKHLLCISNFEHFRYKKINIPSFIKYDYCYRNNKKKFEDALSGIQSSYVVCYTNGRKDNLVHVSELYHCQEEKENEKKTSEESDEHKEKHTPKKTTRMFEMQTFCNGHMTGLHFCSRPRLYPGGRQKSRDIADYTTDANRKGIC